MPARTLRNRLLATLILVALIPAAVTLATGSWALREVVVATGSAGAWDEVAASGRQLLDELEAHPPGTLSPELTVAASRHRDQLGASIRLSRMYALLGERLLFLIPAFSLGLLLLVAGVAVWAANSIARRIAAPAEELAGWTRLLGAGSPLPPPDEGAGARELREFALLRESLRQMARTLEENRARELQQARTQSWSEMARRVAHEIKNPLMPMRMAADRVAASGDERAAESGRILLEEIDRLDALARSFSHFGRPAEGPMSEVDLEELLRSVIRRAESPETPVLLRPMEGSLRIHGHLDALERVFRNLIVNAQEASLLAAGEGAPAPVEVEAGGGERWVEVSVMDRGPGIPGEHLGRIWDPDFTSKRRGTGIGLPLVRQAVRAHGGEVWAANRLEGGAEFRVRLPRHPLPTPSTSPEASPPSPDDSP